MAVVKDVGAFSLGPSVRVTFNVRDHPLDFGWNSTQLASAKLAYVAVVASDKTAQDQNPRQRTREAFARADPQGLSGHSPVVQLSDRSGLRASRSWTPVRTTT
jgi:hypothetical protein